MFCIYILLDKDDDPVSNITTKNSDENDLNMSGGNIIILTKINDIDVLLGCR